MRRLQAAAYFAVLSLCFAQTPERARLQHLLMVSGRAQHSGYTDLVRFNQRWFLAFREGRFNRSPDGAIRVLTSSDGEVWVQAAYFALPGADLRCPRFSVTPNGRLLVSATVEGGETSGSAIWITADGRSWEQPAQTAPPVLLLSRFAWIHGHGFALAGSLNPAGKLRIYTTTGEKFTPHGNPIEAPGRPAESSLLILEDGSAYCLLSREGAEKTVLLGRSRSPYLAWSWQDLKQILATPALLRLPDGRLVAAGRAVDETIRTSLFWLDAEAGRLSEFFALPSSGDTGSPGLVFHDGLLWISYNSSHEGKTAVYLARVKLPPITDNRRGARSLTFGN